MFEMHLARRYIKSQKRHSILTVCSIAAALALVTLLFIGYSTFRGIRRDAAYLDKPYHFKLMQLTEAEYEQLAANPDFSAIRQVTEPDGTLSAEILLGTYHDDLGVYINTLFPEKYLYTVVNDTYKTDLIDVNFTLVELDRLDFRSKYFSVYYLALFFIFIILLILMLRVMIDSAFEISSRQRERQYGILRCIGAAPKQLVRIITFEGLLLCIAGIPAGVLLGLGLSFAAFRMISGSGIAEAFFTAEQIPQVMKLHISPLLLVLGAVTGLVWVMLSAYGTGMRLAKKSPVQAVTGSGTQVKKVRQFTILGTLFGWKGKLAARNSRRQPKRFAITVTALTVSIMLFSMFSIALRQLFAGFEKTVEVLGLDYDFGLAVHVDPGDPLSYREGLETIRSSGYFEIDQYSKLQLAYIPYDEEHSILCLLVYYPRETFDAQFSGEPPVSYDELTAQNAYLLELPEKRSQFAASELLKDQTHLPVLMQVRTPVSDEEYRKMNALEQANVIEAAYDDLQTGEHILLYRYLASWDQAELTLAGTASVTEPDALASEFLGVTHDETNLIVLAGTLDTYENGAYALAGDYGSIVNTEGVERIKLNLKDKGDYESARAFLNRSSSILSIEEDFCGDLRRGRTTVAAVQIGMGFLSVLIGLIAIVNLVNILSTSILNRRSEFAAMQCLGMTRGQLRAMLVIECLEYVLTSGVLATALTELLLLLMQLYLKTLELGDVFTEFLSFTEPLPLIWLAAAAAFLASLAASFVPLHRMQKEDLTEQIRCIE